MSDSVAPKRRKMLIWLAVGAAAVIVIALAIWLSVRGSDPSSAPTESASSSSTPAPSASGTRSAAPSPSASPSATDTAGGPVAPEAAPVAPDEVVVTDDDVEISLTNIESVDGQATVAGEISGPAIRVTVRFENSSGEPLDLGYVVVNAYGGADRAPASSIMRPGGDPVSGSLAPGESAEGVYLFSVPLAERDDVTIAVDYRVGQSTIVFRGPVG